ncbi:5-oxoprolinase subunit PxpB [Saccharibacillus sacchari]|uniref:5-oxoprolinase subunit PxpB n=1 Tax=Saccharibacillus sacchari TaxID=456493 RepID=A0ACC6PG73_9BACL
MDGKEQAGTVKPIGDSLAEKPHAVHLPLIEPLGETAIRAVFGTDISPETNSKVRKLTDYLERQPLPGMIEAVPSFAVVTIFYDPLKAAQQWPGVGHGTVMQSMAELLRSLLLTDIVEKESTSRVIEIPVLYGEEYGSDLNFVARHAGMSEEEVIAIHAAREYPVYMIGFAPGFPYLGGMDPRIAAPRLETPRLSVPAGTVGIAGAQTGVYPLATPGGWRMIGRTPTALFRPERIPPSLLRAGDRVRFRSILREEYDHLANSMADEAKGFLTAREKGFSIERKKGRKEHERTSDGVGRGDNEDYRERDTSILSVTVLKPGLLTTLQDLGRPGYQQYGVTAGGAMDAYALRAANLMAGNAEGEAALEITLAGPALRFERETLIALTGADLAPSVGGVPLPMWRPVRIRAGAVLEFGPPRAGCRAYLALSGGFAAPAALGSRGTDLRAGLGGLEGRALRAGDVLHARTSASTARTAERAFGPLRGIAPGADFAAAAWHAAHGYVAGRPDWGDLHRSGSTQPEGPPTASRSSVAASAAADSVAVRFTRGSHFALFDAPSREALLTAAFRVTPQSDRMGCRLSGPALRLEQPQELISEAVAPGTVQVPADGNPIVLTADRQTTGGYPRIAQIISADLRQIAQLRPGQALSFAEVSLREAERRYIEQERELARLRIALRLGRNG